MILRIIFVFLISLICSCAHDIQPYAKDGYMVHSVYPEVSPHHYSGAYSEVKGKYQKVTKDILGKEWSYYIYDPRKVGDKTEIPALLLFHGAKRSGISMVDHWKDIADQHNVLLIAPNAKSQYWTGSLEEILVMNNIAKVVDEKNPIDFKHLYAFGHSSGANFSLKLAATSSNIFTGIGLHAGMARNLVSYEKKIQNIRDGFPIAIAIGTKDHIFPLDQVQSTAKILSNKGSDVHLYQILGHNHWYYDNAHQINKLVWNRIYHL